MDFNAFIFPAP
jgi:pimeloyl-ACP methyl ester carboxylesterase